MAVTRCDLFVVRGRLIAAVNAAPAATWSMNVSSADDQRRNDYELDKIILANDAKICVGHASKVGDGYRSLFLSLSASIPHLGTIPDHLGPIELVTIKYATTDTTYQSGKFDASLTLDDIQRWRANVGGRYGPAHDAANSVISGYYLRRGSQLAYTGADAKLQIATFVRTLACQAPETDEEMLLGLCLGSALKEGDMDLPVDVGNRINEARSQYAALIAQSEPNPSETIVMAA